MAGAAIPLGAFIAAVERIQPAWLEREFRHSMIAVGGGALLSAVCLVLVPEGIQDLSVGAAAASLLAGGLAFLWVDRLIAKGVGAGSQLMAMLLDFIPEAIALGAVFGTSAPSGILLALLIAFQNLPEGFNAYRELVVQHRKARSRLLFTFFLLSGLGPIAAWLGMTVFATHDVLLATLMLFCAGGILYLTFQDIAPQAKLERAWGPPLGGVIGFLIGVVGYMTVGA